MTVLRREVCFFFFFQRDPLPSGSSKEEKANMAIFEVQPIRSAQNAIATFSVVNFSKA